MNLLNFLKQKVMQEPSSIHSCIILIHWSLLVLRLFFFNVFLLWFNLYVRLSPDLEAILDFWSAQKLPVHTLLRIVSESFTPCQISNHRDWRFSQSKLHNWLWWPCWILNEITDLDEVHQWNNAAMFVTHLIKFVTVKNILMYDAGHQQQTRSDNKCSESSFSRWPKKVKYKTIYSNHKETQH